MKLSLLLLFVFTIASCDGNGGGKSSTNDTTDQVTTTDTNRWINSFREFRDALYQRDIEKAKRLFTFPIMDKDNDLWSMTGLGNYSEGTRPFTERDFEKYFDQIFPNEFVKAILKVKTELLYEKGWIKTESFKEVGYEYEMVAEYDRTERILKLNLNYNHFMEENGEIEWQSESSIIYEFTVLPDGSLKFKEMWIAG